MRLHRVPSNVGIVAHIGVVKVSDSFLVRGTIDVDSIERRKGRHGQESYLELSLAVDIAVDSSKTMILQQPYSVSNSVQ
jgi:hypothetical protein